MQPLQLQDYNSASGDESDESGAKLNENYGVMRCQAFKQCWSFHVLYTNGGQLQCSVQANSRRHAF